GVCQSGNCVKQPKSGSCNDSNPCTVGDQCTNGSCQGGGAKDCADSSVCTTDKCDPSAGDCTHTAVSNGTSCGGTSKCVSGTCKAFSTSCSGKCGVYDNYAPCQCDSLCVGASDCCSNYQSVCGCGDGKCIGGETCVTCAKDCGGFNCSPGATETQSQGCGNCGNQTRSRLCGSGCGWGAWSAWGTCAGQGACQPNATQACAETCEVNTCNGSCQWGGCKLKAGATCAWKGGGNLNCCGVKKHQYCSSGCQWFACKAQIQGPYCASGVPK
ncbi:MAG: hypothetical protein EXR79_07520, partial [Myxococcales bacterium]|nr:hypothetical protein [Myxococcales bacterium]